MRDACCERCRENPYQLRGLPAWAKERITRLRLETIEMELNRTKPTELCVRPINDWDDQSSPTTNI